MPILIVEEWRLVREHNGYEVSDMGRVRNKARGNILKQHRNCSGKGYLFVALGAGKQINVHRLVAGAFIGPCPIGLEVNHIDGDKLNNASTNLEYCTRSENEKHSLRLGLRKPFHKIGQEHPRAKLTEKDVRQIRRLYSSGKYSQSEIGKMYGMKQCSIQHITKRRIWKHI